MATMRTYGDGCAIAQGLDLGFRVDGFWTAVFGAIVISVVSAVLGAVLSDD